MRAHGINDSSSLVTTYYMKRVVNSNKNLVLIVVEAKDPNKSHGGFDPCSMSELLEMGQAYQWGGNQQKYCNVSKEMLECSKPHIHTWDIFY